MNHGTLLPHSLYGTLSGESECEQQHVILIPRLFVIASKGLDYSRLHSGPKRVPRKRKGRLVSAC